MSNSIDYYPSSDNFKYFDSANKENIHHHSSSNSSTNSANKSNKLTATIKSLARTALFSSNNNYKSPMKSRNNYLNLSTVESPLSPLLPIKNSATTIAKRVSYNSNNSPNKPNNNSRTRTGILSPFSNRHNNKGSNNKTKIIETENDYLIFVPNNNTNNSNNNTNNTDTASTSTAAYIVELESKLSLLQQELANNKSTELAVQQALSQRKFELDRKEQELMNRWRTKKSNTTIVPKPVTISISTNTECTDTITIEQQQSKINELSTIITELSLSTEARTEAKKLFQLQQSRLESELAVLEQHRIELNQQQNEINIQKQLLDKRELELNNNRNNSNNNNNNNTSELLITSSRENELSNKYNELIILEQDLQQRIEEFNQKQLLVSDNTAATTTINTDNNTDQIQIFQANMFNRLRAWELDLQSFNSQLNDRERLLSNRENQLKEYLLPFNNNNNTDSNNNNNNNNNTSNNNNIFLNDSQINMNINNSLLLTDEPSFHIETNSNGITRLVPY